jgi:hypothetical protein
MTAIQHVSDLFKPEPVQWGFRGDPHLWEEMASVLSDVPLPSAETQLNALFEATFERLVGSPLHSPAVSVFVERYSHGGMSSGRVSLAFWRETGFPLLRTRYVGA